MYKLDIYFSNKQFNVISKAHDKDIHFYKVVFPLYKRMPYHQSSNVY